MCDGFHNHALLCGWRLRGGSCKDQQVQSPPFTCIEHDTNGVSVVAFAMAYFVEEHRMPFYLVLQIASGFTQSFGWPVAQALSIDSNKRPGRSLVMEIWICNSVVRRLFTAFLITILIDSSWGWMYVATGCSLLVGALLRAGSCHEPKLCSSDSIDNLHGGGLRIEPAQCSPSRMRCYLGALFFGCLITSLFAFSLPFCILRTGISY